MPEMQILWAAALFNLLLCFVDTNALRLSPLPVMAAEAAILAAAFFLPFTRPGRAPGRFDALLLLMVISWLFFAILRQQIDPKYLRDVAIMPIFVLLGLHSRTEGFHPRLFWLHMVIVAFALWEALDVQGFVRVFSIADYFAHTRGSDSQDWWVDSGLYLSAVRPEARFLFPDLALHRLSSVFLEPVSLGNYVVIATIWLAGWWRQIPRTMAWVAVAGTLFLLVGSDSRMATVACLAILAALPVKRFIPRLAPVFVAPVVIAAMVLAVVLLGLETGLDTFGGRIAHAVELFHDFTLANWAGLALDKLKAAEDAGFGYLIMVHSLPVAATIWILLFRRELRTVEGRYMHLAIAIYVALNLTVSWSIFSIKTAALLWFMLGRSIREDEEAPEAIAANGASVAQRSPLRSAT
ncbi:polysaccharide biosynthesis protein GumE [Sphingomonas rosea]|uniref:Polysaccharide biosynthesis protein GumE n=2 Tax=Sphingomonas rosea TaxID=335605 RepID=A0ABP7TNN9_9SPHN